MSTDEQASAEVAGDTEVLRRELDEIKAAIATSGRTPRTGSRSWLRRLDDALFSPPHTIESVVAMILPMLQVEQDNKS